MRILIGNIIEFILFVIGHGAALVLKYEMIAAYNHISALNRA